MKTGRIHRAILPGLIAVAVHAEPAAFFEKHCIECHDADTHKGGLDLTALKRDYADTENFARWVKVHDRIESGEMPPKKKARPGETELKNALASLSTDLVNAERARLDAQSRTGLRRMTRAEYENTVRDLFAMPGIRLQDLLPADGSAHGFDNNSDALDISHVNLSKYIEAADKVLDAAIATRPTAPPVEKFRLSLAGNYMPDLMLLQGDAMLLKDKKIDPDFPPAGAYPHVGHGPHDALKAFEDGSSVGVFRHEDESWSAYFQKFASIYQGRYKVRASFWSMMWDRGKILPARGIEAARLSVVSFNENGRGGGHPSTVLGYYDAPSLQSKEHEFDIWLNPKESFGFNTSSLAHVVLYRVGMWGQVDRTMGYTGPCIVSDWLDVEGPFNEVWPPPCHRLLFGELPIEEVDPKADKETHFPKRKLLKQEIIGAKNKPDDLKGLWTVRSEKPLDDARRLLGEFLPKAFRHPVSDEVKQQYLALVDARLKAGDCFELAMRYSYRAALTSPDFLYHIEEAGRLDDHALASRLSGFLWNSQPDTELSALAAKDSLHDAKALHQQAERLLGDKKSQRFIEDFLGQWLKLRSIGANDPDKKLYPEFLPYLQDSMVAETRAYFRELIEKNLDAGHLVKSDFAMLNEKLAQHYGIPGVSGTQIRRVALPPGCPRGGFLTQAAILKVTANGTTTSPVPRGAFVLARLLGRPPEPPPPNVPAVEPDVRGATTIREQLNKHRSDPVCGSCHAKIDPPGFALESFDVIGGFRERYRSLENGDAAPRGNIDPKIGISFKLGPTVDPSGALADGRPFKNVNEMKDMLAADPHGLLKNLAQHLVIYATGRDIAFSDRAALNEIVTRTEKQGGGIRTLLHEVAQSSLFQTR